MVMTLYDDVSSEYSYITYLYQREGHLWRKLIIRLSFRIIFLYPPIRNLRTYEVFGGVVFGYAPL